MKAQSAELLQLARELAKADLGERPEVKIAWKEETKDFDKLKAEKSK